MTISRRTMIGSLGLGAVAALVWRPEIGSAAEVGSVRLSPAEWRKRLGPQRYNILREAGTERAYSSPLNKERRRGTFTCAGCALPLFASATKYDSKTGWPSFYRALPKAVVERKDTGMFIPRTEIVCRRCGGHLGHVFDDGPPPTGLRYCMNGLALSFRPA